MFNFDAENVGNSTYEETFSFVQIYVHLLALLSCVNF